MKYYLILFLLLSFRHTLFSVELSLDNTMQSDELVFNCSMYIKKNILEARSKVNTFEKYPDNVQVKILFLKYSFTNVHRRYVYAECSDTESRIQGFVFEEIQASYFNHGSVVYEQPVYMLGGEFEIDVKDNDHFYGNIGSLAHLHDTDGGENDKYGIIKSIREKYKDNYFTYNIKITDNTFTGPLSDDKKKKIIDKIIKHIINYDLTRNAKNPEEMLGKIPENISITIMPFDEDSTYFTYLYNNTTPYRTLRNIYLNSRGDFDEIQSWQSPGAVNNPEIQYIDYRWNPDGGYTLYELDKDYFKHMEENGIKVIIDVKDRTWRYIKDQETKSP